MMKFKCEFHVSVSRIFDSQILFQRLIPFYPTPVSLNTLFYISILITNEFNFFPIAKARTENVGIILQRFNLANFWILWIPMNLKLAYTEKLTSFERKLLDR